MAVEFIQKSICGIAPDRDQCEQLTEMLVPVAIDWLRNSATPGQLCSTAGVCGTEMLAQPINQLHERRMRREAVRDSMGCSMCEYVMRTLKVELDDPLALQNMKKQALEVCDRLPADIAPTCIDLINTYGDVLVQMIESLDPTASCQAVGLCVPPQLKAARLPPLPRELVAALGILRRVTTSAQLSTSQPKLAGSNSLGGNMCDMCKLTVLEMHTLVSNPQVQQQATQYAEALCGSLGAPMADTCKTYIDTYAPTLFTALEQYLVQADQLCQSFGMCDKAAPRTVARTAVIRPRTDDDAVAGSTPDDVVSASMEVVRESLQRAGAAGLVAGLAAVKQLLPGAVLDEAAKQAHAAEQEQGQGDEALLDIADPRLAARLSRAARVADGTGKVSVRGEAIGQEGLAGTEEMMDAAAAGSVHGTRPAEMGEVTASRGREARIDALLADAAAGLMAAIQKLTPQAQAGHVGQEGGGAVEEDSKEEPGQNNVSAMAELLGTLLLPKARVQEAAQADGAGDVSNDKGLGATVRIAAAGRERDSKSARKLVA